MPNGARSVVQVRLSAAEKRRVRAAAAQDGHTVSTWLRSILLRELEREETRLRERGTIE